VRATPAHDRPPIRLRHPLDLIAAVGASCRVGVAETAPIYMSLHIILAPDIAPFRNVTSAITATPANANGISERSSALSASRS